MAKNIFEFDGTIQFDKGDINKQISAISTSIQDKIGQQVLDFKISKDATKELRDFSKGVEALNADLDLSRLNSELQKIKIEKGQAELISQLADSLTKLNKSIKPKTGDNFASMSKGLDEFLGNMKEYKSLSDDTVAGLNNITRAFKEFQTASAGIDSLNKLGTAMRKIAGAEGIVENLTSMGSALGMLQEELKKYTGIEEALTVPIKFEVQTGEFGKILSGLEQLDVSKQTEKLQSDLSKVQSIILDTASGFEILGKSAETGLSETGHTLANALQLATNLGLIMRDVEGAQTATLAVTQDVADAKGVLIDVQAESIKAQEGGEKLWGQLDKVIDKSAKMEKAFTEGKTGEVQNYFNQLIKSTTTLGNTIAEVETAYSRIMDAGGTLSQKQLSELRGMKSEYDGWVQKIRDVQEQQEILAKTALKVPPMFSEGDAEQAKIMASTMAAIAEDMDTLKSKTASAEGELTSLLSVGNEITRLEENISKVLADSSIEAQHFREQARGIRDELQSIKGNYFDETFKGIEQVSSKTDDSIKKFSELRDQLRATEADGRYLTQLHNGIRDLNNELLSVEQTIAQMEKSGGFLQGDFDLMNEKRDALKILIKDFEELSSKQAALSKHTKDNAVSVSEFEKAVQQLNTAFKEQGNLTSGFQAAISAYTGIETEIVKVKESLGQMGQQVYTINSQFEDHTGQLNKLVFEYDSYSGTLVNTKKEVSELYKEQTALDQSFEGLFQHLSATSVVMRGFYQAINELRSGISFVGEVNDQLTQLAIVQDTSFAHASGQLEGMVRHADNLNRSISDVLNTSVELARQGLGESQVDERMESILKLSSVARMSVEDATKAITVGVNAMGEEVNRTGDVLLRASQKAATNVEGLAQGFSVSAASAHALGMNIEETSAMIAVLTERTQLAETRVGNAVKTMLARFNQIKAGDLGKDELNQVQAAIEGIAGVDFTQANGQIRSMYDILGDLAGVWETLDQNQQAAIATAAGGTHMQQFFYALMDGYEDVIALSDDLVSSTGDVDRAYEKWMNSSEAATKNLEKAWEKFSLSLMDSSGLSAIKNILAAVLTLGEKIGGLSIIGGVAFAAISSNAKNSTKAVAQQTATIDRLKQANLELAASAKALKAAESKGSTEQVQKLTEQIAKTKELADVDMARMFKGLNLREKIGVLQNKEIVVNGEILKLSQLGNGSLTVQQVLVQGLTLKYAALIGVIKSTLLGLARTALMTAGIAAVTAGIGKLTEGFRQSREENEKLVESMRSGQSQDYITANEQMVSSLQDQILQLENKRKSIGLNNEEMQTYTDLSNQLGGIIPELVVGEDEHGNKLLDKTKIYSDLNEQIRETNKLRGQEAAMAFSNPKQGGKAISEDIKEVTRLTNELRREISKSADDIAIVEQAFGMGIGEIKAQINNEEFILRIKEMSPEEWAQLSSSTQSRFRELSYAMDNTGRMMADQIKNSIMAETGEIPRDIAAMLGSPEMQQMMQEAVSMREAAGMGGHEAALAFRDSFTNAIISDDSAMNALREQFTGIGEKIAEIQEAVREGTVEISEAEETYVELKRDQLEIMGEMAGLNETQIENLLDEIENTELLRDLKAEIAEITNETNENGPEKMVENYQNLRSEMEELNKLSIDLANAGEEWGVSMNEAMNNVIAKFPEMASLYGDQENMLLALSNTHDNVANRYIDALMTMALGEQTRTKMSGQAWAGLVQLMANGMSKNLENDAEWGSLKADFHEALIEALAGGWAKFYEVSEDGLVVLSKAGDAHIRKLEAQVRSANEDRETTKAVYERLASDANVDEGKLSGAYTEYMAANEAYLRNSVNLYDTRTEMSRVQGIIQESITGFDNLRIGMEELNTSGKKIDGMLNNVGNVGSDAMDKLSKGGNKAGGAGKKAAKGADKHSKALDKNKQKIDEAKEALEKLKEAQDKVQESIRQTQDAMKAIEAEYDKYNKALNWTYDYLVKIYEQQKKDLLDRENTSYKRDKSLLSDGTDPDAADPFAVVNPDNVKDNIKKIEEAYKEASDKIAKDRAKEDDAREKAWENELKAIQKAGDERKKALQNEIDALNQIREIEEYRKNLMEKQKEIGKLAAKVEDLGLDDSLSGKSQKLKAQEELQAAQKDYVDFIADREFNNILDIYNHKMQLLDQENQYRYQAAVEELEDRKKMILEEVAARRKEEDKLREDAKQAEVDGQNRRLQLLEIAHKQELKSIEEAYSKKEIYLKANHALATGQITDIDGKTMKLYDAIMQYRKNYEDGWSIFKHKREEETKKYLKDTSDAINKLGLDSNEHLKNWSVESDKTYQKLKSNLADLNKQHESLVARQKELNNEIKALQKSADAAAKSARNAEGAVKRASGAAGKLASDMANFNRQYQNGLAKEKKLKADIQKKTHTIYGLQQQQKQLHDQNKIDAAKLAAEKKKKEQLERDKAAAKRNDVAATGRQGGSFGVQSYHKYADGGVVTHTGPAIVHGSKSAPEYVFNTPQMKALASMIAGKASGRGAMQGALPKTNGPGIYAENFIKIEGNADSATVRQLKSTGQDMFQKFEQVMRSQGKGLKK